MRPGIGAGTERFQWIGRLLIRLHNHSAPKICDRKMHSTATQSCPIPREADAGEMVPGGEAPGGLEEIE